MSQEMYYEWRFLRFTGTDLDLIDLSEFNGEMSKSKAQLICQAHICCADAYLDGVFVGAFVDLPDGKVTWVGAGAG